MMVAGACADTTWDTHTLSVCAPYAAEVGWEMGLGDLEMVDGDEADHGEVVVPETDRQTKNDVSLAPPSREELTRGARRRTALAGWCSGRRGSCPAPRRWRIGRRRRRGGETGPSTGLRRPRPARGPRRPTGTSGTAVDARTAAAAASVSAPPPLRRTSYANSAARVAVTSHRHTAPTSRGARRDRLHRLRRPRAVVQGMPHLVQRGSLTKKQHTFLATRLTCWPTLAPTRGQTDV
mmetsp:Transcript_3146/g.10410  ORF Transcript_3146/g.10410 Transcript_3146/m.10410 type:complete len:236 (+) Transcript_3146:339-1046(+)